MSNEIDDERCLLESHYLLCGATQTFAVCPPVAEVQNPGQATAIYFGIFLLTAKIKFLTTPSQMSLANLEINPGKMAISADRLRNILAEDLICRVKQLITLDKSTDIIV